MNHSYKHLSTQDNVKFNSNLPIVFYLGITLTIGSKDRSDSNTEPFGAQPLFDHLHTELVLYSDPHSS